MYVVIDSNIYCGDYFARSAPFRYLIHFLNNAGHTLLIPRVVLQEVPNVRARKVAEESEGLRKALASLRRMTESSFPYPHSEITSDDYDLQAVMSERVEDVEVIEYLHVDHATIFQRALNVRRPFRPGEKGYRDTLLWLSLLQFLKSKPFGTEVVFINGNKNDFYADEHDIKFHPDLLKDLEATPNLLMRPFLSLAAFVDAEIDKEEHAIDRMKTAPIFEGYLEEQALELFESADSAFLRELEEARLPGTRLFDHATGVSASLMEGVEDLDITATSDVGGDDVYVSCEHDLRIVIFEITIPDTDYEPHKNAITDNSAFYEVEEMDRTILLKTCARVYLSASFTFNRISKECTGYSATVSGVR